MAFLHEKTIKLKKAFKFLLATFPRIVIAFKSTGRPTIGPSGTGHKKEITEVFLNPITKNTVVITTWLHVIIVNLV